MGIDPLAPSHLPCSAEALREGEGEVPIDIVWEGVYSNTELKSGVALF